MKRFLVYVLSIGLVGLNTVVNTSSSSAFTIGCRKAQSESEMLSSRSKIGMDLEKKYLSMGLYGDAYRFYFRANEDYRDWERVVAKSPKCFNSSTLSRTRRMLKPISGYQDMSSRYGYEIARRNNFGSPDPCFKYLGEDNAYLKCRISVGEKEGRNGD